MTQTSATMLALTLFALTLTGCTGAIWGNLLVLGITVGIFFGTLALGRTPSGQSRDASTSSTGSTS